MMNENLKPSEAFLPSDNWKHTFAVALLRGLETVQDPAERYNVTRDYIEQFSKGMLEAMDNFYKLAVENIMLAPKPVYVLPKK